MSTYRSSDGQHWEPAEPLGWQEEHSWPVRVIYAVLGISHCGKKGWRR